MAKDLTAEDVELVVDDELKNCIPASSEEEDRELKASIEKDGRFTDPIRYWRENGKALVVDGHRRIDVWNGLPDDTPIPPPRVEEMLFPDRAAAINWMLLYQLSRRNLDPKKASLLRGRLYNREKKTEGRPRETPVNKGDSEKRVQNEPVSTPQRTAEKVAAQTHVAPSTVKRDGEYATAIEVIRDVNSKAASDIESGTLRASKQDTIAISRLPKASVGSALRNLRNGLKWDAGLNGQATAAADPKTKRKKSSAKNPKPLADLKKAAAVMNRAIVKAGEQHGKGEHYRSIFAACTKINESIEAWEKSCK